MSPASPEPTGNLAAAPAVSTRELDRSLVSGVTWTAIAKWGGQLISWSSTLIVARLLKPSDYGILGITTVYLGLITLVSEFGLGSTILNMHDLTEEKIRQLNTVSVLLGVVGWLASLAGAKPMAAFFHTPELVLVVPVMGVGFLLGGFRVVPVSVLQKELRFKLVSLMDAARAFAQAVVTLVLAWLGAGYWSLIFGGLAGTLLGSLLPCLWAPRGFGKPATSSLTRELTFSWQVLVARLCWYFYSNADFVVAGRVLGQAALGVYTLAWTIANMPIERVTNLVTSVTPSILPKVQFQHAELRRYLRVLTECIALVTFPMCMGLALVSHDLVVVAFGAKWTAAALPLTLLALYATPRCIATLLPQVLTAINRARFVMWVSLGMALLFPPAFLIGSRWGAAGIAAAWMIVYPLVSLPLYVETFRSISMGIKEYMAALWPACSGAVVMVAGVLAFRAVAPFGLPTGVRLIVESVLGAAIYAGMMLQFHRSRIQRLIGLVRGRASAA